MKESHYNLRKDKEMNRTIGIGLGAMVAILLLSTSCLFAYSQDLEQDIEKNDDKIYELDKEIFEKELFKFDLTCL